jgi:hypothetical protein
MATSINRRRVVVQPILRGPDFLGNSESEAVDWDAVPLTDGYLSSLGGLAYRVGQPWQIQLALKYIDANGLTQALDLTGASNIVMHIWHKASAAWVATRTQGTVVSGSVKELEVNADPTTGLFTIAFGASETPQTGYHRFAVMADWALTDTVAAGTIEVVPALPSSS